VLFCLFFQVARAQKIKMNDNNGSLTFRYGSRDLVAYQYKMVYPPAGKDTNYKRSGFIHPLYAPHGQVLTRIQPPDHYHHYGIWNPWTHTLFEGDTVDFWNLKEHQGTVRFSRFTAKNIRKNYAEYTALHEHVKFNKDGTETVALDEWQTVRVYAPAKGKDYYIMDITSRLRCAGSSPFLILAYRYAGLGWRATEYWDRNNMEVLTSEGKTRDNADNTNAKWILSQGVLPENDYGGILMMSHPDNHNHPEPLRIWDKTQNSGRGDYFANFSPAKEKDWQLEPGNDYVLKYRLLVFNGKLTKEKAEEAWQQFAGTAQKH